jgi:hypothetical protein
MPDAGKHALGDLALKVPGSILRLNSPLFVMFVYSLTVSSSSLANDQGINYILTHSLHMLYTRFWSQHPSTITHVPHSFHDLALHYAPF